MEYIIVDAATFNELQAEVNTRLKKGYELVGGLSFWAGNNEGDQFCAQAMLKPAE